MSITIIVIHAVLRCVVKSDGTVGWHTPFHDRGRKVDLVPNIGSVRIGAKERSPAEPRACMCMYVCGLFTTLFWCETLPLTMYNN